MIENLKSVTEQLPLHGTHRSAVKLQCIVQRDEPSHPTFSSDQLLLHTILFSQQQQQQHKILFLLMKQKKTQNKI